MVVGLAIHDVDIMYCLLGMTPTGLQAAAGRALLSDRYDHAEVFLTYNRTGCFVLVNWITPVRMRTLSVTGDRGHAELNYVTQELEIYGTDLERTYNSFGDFIVRFGRPRTTLVPVEVHEPLEVEVASFVEAIRKGVPPRVTGEDGVQVMHTMDQIPQWLRRSEDQ